MSIKIFYILALFIFVLNKDVSAQEKDSFKSISKTVIKTVADNIIGDEIKDSTAIYSFSIKITVNKQSTNNLVETEINNEMAKSFFVGLEELKKIDYSALIKSKKQAKFIVSAVTSPKNWTV